MNLNNQKKNSSSFVLNNLFEKTFKNHSTKLSNIAKETLEPCKLKTKVNKKSNKANEITIGEELVGNI